MSDVVYMKKNRIYYSPKTQFSNMGDCIINKILLEQLRVHGKLHLNTSGCPEWYLDAIDCRTEDRLNGLSFYLSIFLYAILSLFNGNAVYMCMKPGHIFERDQRVHTYIKAICKVMFFAILWVVRVRICRFGASTGPFTGVHAILERFRAKLFRIYTVRDSLSLAYSQSIGIASASYCPDMAFLLCQQNTVGLYSSATRHVTLSFRAAAMGTSVDEAYSQRIFSVLTPLSNIKSTRFYVSYQVMHDREMMAQIQALLPDCAWGECFTETVLSISHMFDFYNTCDVVVSNRLHVLLFAASRGAIPVPVIDSDANNKIAGIFNDSGIGDLIYDLNEDSRTLVDHIEHVFSQHDSIKQRLAQVFIEKNSNIHHTISQFFSAG